MKPGKFGGGGMNMQSMLKKAQKMQEEMLKAQQALENETYTATSGGGAVTVTIKGNNQLTNLVIKPDVIDPSDAEMLQDLIVSAVNAALKQVDDASNSEMQKLSGGGKALPGML